MTIRKLLLGIVATLLLVISPALALEFPGTCISPPATVTSITDIDTRYAKMVAHYTMEDVIAACHEGYVDQSNAAPDVCIAHNRKPIEVATIAGDR
jgi:hypothetical protein